MAARLWRWWFADRRTGRITIVQFPNWTIWCIVGCWVARIGVGDTSAAYDVLGWLIRGLWLLWGADEIVRGVNPWRRLLGAGVIAWQLASMLG